MGIKAEGGRIGGDEFATILWTDAKGAEAVRKRFLEIYDEEMAKPENADIRDISGVSIGVATLEPGMTASRLLATADARMYEDKESHVPEIDEQTERLFKNFVIIFEEMGVRRRDIPKLLRALQRNGKL